MIEDSRLQFFYSYRWVTLTFEPVSFSMSSMSRLMISIGVDLAGILGGRMVRAEGGLVPSGVEYGEG